MVAGPGQRQRWRRALSILSRASVSALSIGIVFSALLSPWLIIGIHERAHAVVALKHTSPGALTAIRIGKRGLCRLPVKYGQRFGLTRVEILVGRVPSGGRCGHAHIADHQALVELYAAGVKATGKAGLVAGALCWLLVRAAYVLPTAGRHIVLCIPGAVLAFAIISLADCVFNLVPVRPKWPRIPEGSDGYVLYRLARDSTYVPEQQSAEELLREHAYTPR
jgi:hypothetical protein